MNFNAKQLREDALIPKGQYRFKVIQGREKTSSSGNDMMVLKMDVFVNDKPVKFWATLMFIPKMFWLVEHFLKAVGMEEKIEEGNLMAQDCDNAEGWLLIDHRINKESGVIEEYVKDFLYDIDTKESKQNDHFNDEVTF